MASPSSPEVLANELSWSSEIGRFVINFGMLDYRMFEFLEEHLPPADFEKLRGKHFKDRVDAVCGCIAPPKYSADRCAAFDNFAVHIDAIRKLGNHIAHGYLLCRLEGQMQLVVMLCNTKDLYVEHFPNSVRLEFAALHKLNTDLSNLLEQFNSATGQPEPRKTTFGFTFPSSQ